MPAPKPYSEHEVACLLADLIGDDCACNVNGNDEWLPQYCDLFSEDRACNPDGVACWEQYLKHLDKRPKIVCPGCGSRGDWINCFDDGTCWCDRCGNEWNRHTKGEEL